MAGLKSSSVQIAADDGFCLDAKSRPVFGQLEYLQHEAGIDHDIDDAILVISMKRDLLFSGKRNDFFNLNGFQWGFLSFLALVAWRPKSSTVVSPLHFLGGFLISAISTGRFPMIGPSFYS